MRDAADLLRRHPPSDVPQTEIERLIEAIEAPYGARIQKMIREAMRAEEEPARQAVAVADGSQGAGP